MENSLKGEKIRCEGHKIEKPFRMKCVSKDGHHEMCVIVRHGGCKVIKTFRWEK